VFTDLETQQDIAARHSYSLASIRGFAMENSWPEAVRVIGRTHFYRKADVDKWFARKVDRRFREFKRRKPRR
jgi:hypothetical protein